MVGPGNQHCASCIGTLSFPVTHVIADVTASVVVNRTRKCAENYNKLHNKFIFLSCSQAFW